MILLKWHWNDNTAIKGYKYYWTKRIVEDTVDDQKKKKMSMVLQDGSRWRSNTCLLKQRELNLPEADSKCEASVLSHRPSKNENMRYLVLILQKMGEGERLKGEVRS